MKTAYSADAGLVGATTTPDDAVVSGELTDDEVENLVRRSYQYVAIYNVINKNVLVCASQTETDGWNLCFADTALKDDAYQAIAFLRVLPHAAEPERMMKNLAAMEEVAAWTAMP